MKTTFDFRVRHVFFLLMFNKQTDTINVTQVSLALQPFLT